MKYFLPEHQGAHNIKSCTLKSRRNGRINRGRPTAILTWKRYKKHELLNFSQRALRSPSWKSRVPVSAKTRRSEFCKVPEHVDCTQAKRLIHLCRNWPIWSTVGNGNLLLFQTFLQVWITLKEIKEPNSISAVSCFKNVVPICSNIFTL